MRRTEARDAFEIVFSVPGGQEYRPSDLFLDADWSSAAYFAVAGAVASSLGRIEGITLRNMRLDSLQADERYSTSCVRAVPM